MCPPAGRHYQSTEMRRRLDALGVPHVPGRTAADAQAILADLARQGKITALDAAHPWRLDPARPEDFRTLDRLNITVSDGTPCRGEVEDVVAKWHANPPATDADRQWMRDLAYDPAGIVWRADLQAWIARATPPFPEAIDYLRGLGGTITPHMTDVQARQAIDQLRPTAPPSEGQLAYLADLGAELDVPLTRWQASDFLDYLIAQRDADIDRRASTFLRRTSPAAPAPAGCLPLCLLLLPALLR